MRYVSISFVLSILLLPVCSAQAQFRVGASKVDITPSNEEIAAGKVWLGGFNYCGITDRTAKGVMDNLYARAIVISDGSTTLAFAVTDTPGQSNRRINSIRSKASRATGIPESNILISATHTHSGPDMQGLWCGSSNSYKEFYDQKVADAITAAASSLRDARIRAATMKLPGHQKETRGWNMTDEDLSTIQAVDLNGTPIATLISYAAHAEFFGPDNRLLSRDWPGAMVDRIEQRGGGIGLFNAGAVGAVNPRWDNSDKAQGMREYGQRIADVGLDNLSNGVDLSAPIKYKHLTTRIAIKNGLFLGAYTLGFMDYDLIYPCREGGGLIGFPCVSTLVSYLRFGPSNGCQIQAATAPGELLTRAGLKAKEGMRAPHRLLIGLTSNTLGYGVPMDEWLKAPNETNYHENVSPWVRYGETIVNKIHDLSEGDCQ
jgi:hypothetical protein